MLIQCNYAQCSNTWQTARLPTFLIMIRVKGILGLVLHEDVNLFRVIGRCEFGLCEDLNSTKRHSIIDYFALILWRSFPFDGISMLFISLILMSASRQAPVLKITCWRCGALTIIARGQSSKWFCKNNICLMKKLVQFQRHCTPCEASPPADPSVHYGVGSQNRPFCKS